MLQFFSPAAWCFHQTGVASYSIWRVVRHIPSGVWLLKFRLFLFFFSSAGSVLSVISSTSLLLLFSGVCAFCNIVYFSSSSHNPSAFHIYSGLDLPQFQVFTGISLLTQGIAVPFWDNMLKYFKYGVFCMFAHIVKEVIQLIWPLIKTLIWNFWNNMAAW